MREFYELAVSQANRLGILARLPRRLLPSRTFAPLPASRPRAKPEGMPSSACLSVRRHRRRRLRRLRRRRRRQLPAPSLVGGQRRRRRAGRWRSKRPMADDETRARETHGRGEGATTARRRCGGGPIRMEKRESARGGSQKTSAIPSALQQQRQSDYSVSLYNVDKQRRSVQQHGVCLSSEALGRFHHVLRPEEGLDRPGPGRSHLECQL